MNTGGRDFSLAATFTTEAFNTGQKSKFDLQATTNPDATTGVGAVLTDAVGTLAVQASDDNANWVTVAFKDESDVTQTSIALSGFTDNTHTWELAPFGASWVRVVYTRTSGGATDELRLKIVGKRY